MTAHAVDTRTADGLLPSRGGPLDALRRLAARWAERRAAKRRYLITYFELAQLSDRQLEDIGLTRGDIRAAALRDAA